MTQTLQKTPSTLGDILGRAVEHLKAKGYATPRLDAELLLAHSLEFSRIDLYTKFDRPLDASEVTKFRNLLIRRLQQEPVAYIVGKKEFMGLPFFVSRDVLIPRSETEVLVETALEIFRPKGEQSLHILDLGVGSGCVGLSLLHHLPQSTLEGWDVSDALQVAEQNARHFGFDSSRYCFKKKDMLADDWERDHTFDLIVSNPPYIAESERENLAESVSRYEPAIALFAPDNGLKFYKKIADCARTSLKKDGRLLVEIGASQKEEVVRAFSNFGWQDIRSHKDLIGHDRVVEGRYG